MPLDGSECHRCGMKGHWLKECPTRDSLETQNNIDKTSIGIFRCKVDSCNTVWSAHIRANTAGKCQGCGKFSYPVRTFQLSQDDEAKVALKQVMTLPGRF